MTDKLSRSARQALIASLVERHDIRSQSELTDLLAADGVAVTQGTVSKDLLELGAVRVRREDGQLSYTIPDGGQRRDTSIHDARLAKLCTEVLLSAQSSANLAVLHTPPGAAQYFASAIDKAVWPSILGTIAGDDTVMVIATDADGGAEVARALLELAGGARGSRHPEQPDQTPPTLTSKDICD